MVRTILVVVLSVFVISFSASAEESPKVFFDEAHGQAFVISRDGDLQLSKLAKVLREEGLEPVTSKDVFSSENLKNIKAVVISGPFKPITEKDIEVLVNYVKDGGKLAVMLHIAQPAHKLFERFGIFITQGPVTEPENLATTKKTDFFITDLEHHPLTKDLKRFAVYGSWGLVVNNKDIKVIAKSSNSSWLDFNRNGVKDGDEPAGPFAIIVAGNFGQGGFVFFADDAIFQNRFLTDDNEILARNLAKFLKN